MSMNPPDREAFGAAVKDALDRRGLGVREVARRSRGGISTTSVLNMLDGHITSSDVIIEFAEAVTAQEGPQERQELADRLLLIGGKRTQYRAPSAVSVREWAAEPRALVEAA